MKKKNKIIIRIVLSVLIILLSTGSIFAFSQYERDVSDRLYKDLDKKYDIEEFSSDSTEAKTLNRLVKNLSNKEMKKTGFKVYYIDSDVINAYYIGNGKIMLFRGLLDELETSEQLAGLLAHEMGHAYHRHLYKDLENNMGITVLGLLFNYFTDNQYANITNIAQNLISKGFSREQEQEADLFAVDLMFKSDYNPQGLVELMKIFKEKSGGSKVLEFTRTHPVPDTRIEYISNYIDEKSGKRIKDVSVENIEKDDKIPEINRNNDKKLNKNDDQELSEGENINKDSEDNKSVEGKIGAPDKIKLTQEFSDQYFSISYPESWEILKIRKQRSDELAAYQMTDKDKNIDGEIRIFDLENRDFMETVEKNYRYQLISDDKSNVIKNGKLQEQREGYYVYKENDLTYNYEYLISLKENIMLKVVFIADKKINEEQKENIIRTAKSIVEK